MAEGAQGPRKEAVCSIRYLSDFESGISIHSHQRSLLRQQSSRVGCWLFRTNCGGMANSDIALKTCSLSDPFGHLQLFTRRLLLLKASTAFLRASSCSSRHKRHAIFQRVLPLLSCVVTYSYVKIALCISHSIGEPTRIKGLSCFGRDTTVSAATPGCI